VAVPIYVFVEAPWRALVVRLAAALVLGVALRELRGTLGRRLSRAGDAAQGAGSGPAVTGPDVPLRLLNLADDVRAGVRSRRHFERVLWPRLEALSRQPLAPPPLRSFRRGPRLADVRAVVAALERQP
jgi:hypothetical protein